MAGLRDHCLYKFKITGYARRYYRTDEDIGYLGTEYEPYERKLNVIAYEYRDHVARARVMQFIGGEDIRDLKIEITEKVKIDAFVMEMDY